MLCNIGISIFLWICFFWEGGGLQVQNHSQGWVSYMQPLPGHGGFISGGGDGGSGLLYRFQLSTDQLTFFQRKSKMSKVAGNKQGN